VLLVGWAGKPTEFVPVWYGLGSVLAGHSRKARTIRPAVMVLLRALLGRGRSRVLVQNLDDRRAIERLGIAADRIALIPGSGVDIEAMTPLPEPGGAITVAFAARLIEVKGIRTLVAAHEILAGRGRSAWARVFPRIRRHRGAVVGAAIVAALVLIAFGRGMLAPQSPTKIDITAALHAPDGVHWMGTDQYGRDVYSRVVHGSRISLTVGFISVGIAALAGTAVGLIAGFNGGRVDTLLMRVIDVMLAFPGILLALAIVSVLGPSLPNLMIAVGISNIPFYARLVRGSVLVAREQMYVEAARVVGVPVPVIIVRHVLPNVVAPIIVAATLGMGNAILAAAALSFIGLGSQPPTPEWGRMLSEGRDYLRDAWWISTFPGFGIMFTVLGVNLLGDGLRDVLDPRLRI